MSKTFSWFVAFAASSFGATLMVWNAIADMSPREVQVRARDPKSLSEIDLEIIVGRIREGDLYALKGDLAGAKVVWSLARRMGEGLWPVHHGLALSYARNGMHAEAEVEFAAAEKLVADDAAVASGLRCQRALNLRKLTSDTEALRLLLDGDHPAVPVDLVAALAGGDMIRARMVEAKAEIDPRYWAAACAALVKSGDKAKASRALGKVAVLFAPWDPNIVGQAVAALREQKKVDEAVEVCRAHAKAAPGQIDVWELMGDVLTEAGRDRDALVAYTSIVDVRPGDADAHRRLGAIFRRLNKFSEAIAQFEAVKKLRPEEPDGARAIAETLLAKGDLDGALAAFEEMQTRAWDARFNVKATLKAPLTELYSKQIAAARGNRAKQDELRKRAASAGITELGIHELKILMTWDTATDIDLYVTDPKGEVVSYQKMTSSSGAVYFIDDRDGYGPETYALAKAPVGTYKVEANFCGGSARTNVRITVVVHEGEEREIRSEHSLVLEAQNARKAIADVVVR